MKVHLLTITSKHTVGKQRKMRFACRSAKMQILLSYSKIFEEYEYLFVFKVRPRLREKNGK